MLLFTVLHIACTVFAQVRFSVVTGASLMRNFSPQQKFWSLGQIVEANMHVKEGTVYGSIGYFLQGTFDNEFFSPARSAATQPTRARYTVEGKWTFRQVSLGWKHFFKGSFREQEKMNVYGSAGFGLLFSKAANRYLSRPDTSLYELPSGPLEGADEFKRLTLDFSLGVEYNLGPGYYLWSGLRTSVPTSHYPSPFFHNTEKVPLAIIAGFGLRILFGQADD